MLRRFRFIKDVFGCWRSVTYAALLTPAPVYLFALVAWMAGSTAWMPAIELAFEVTTKALLAGWLAGLPLVLIFRQLRLRNALIFMLAGVVLALLAQQFLPDLSVDPHPIDNDEFHSFEFAPPAEPTPAPFDGQLGPDEQLARLWAIAAGVLAGWLCHRRERRAMQGRIVADH